MDSRLDSLIKMYSEKGPVILLESQSEDHPASRYSYLAAIPEASIEAKGTEVTIFHKGDKKKFSENPLEALGRFYEEQSDWMFGYLGYDLKNFIEKLTSENRDQVQAPDLYFIVPGVLIRYDRQKNNLEYIKGRPAKEERAGTAQGNSPQISSLGYTVTRNDYLQCIEEAQRRITEGDFYELNLSHQLKADFEGDPFALYKKMRDIGPVPFGAYIEIENIAICSMSPERFLAREANRVYSQPIKGTIQRGADESNDQRLRAELSSSVKDRAENLMIVDLVRNDLSKIARKGSVKVSDLFQIQTFGTVHQMVSTVEAESETENPIEIIKACYPMGSMTGAPKISAMKAIEELENYRRGIYSGAIGYFKPNGEFDFNVVIRTAIITGDNLFYSVGGAITGDSDPELEWEETLVKARALTKVLKE
ncbi:aminodeoxychorismate synthase component I [Balneolaceae bacterium YR4-1]|uniref:aminodeoxychorismate synthase n=1 Tax=Halalkalibaculum roseum TaxID=2709311 RepID=A0A6M1SM43_9BACT|nr:aminodeoxychorismate synthase component I [Halalkalibaculum roseum]NGP76079.1 aminodeoxychorismate synthase component I [Halalkalibaculum roseum]